MNKLVEIIIDSSKFYLTEEQILESQQRGCPNSFVLIEALKGNVDNKIIFENQSSINKSFIINTDPENFKYIVQFIRGYREYKDLSLMNKHIYEELGFTNDNKQINVFAKQDKTEQTLSRESDFCTIAMTNTNTEEKTLNFLVNNNDTEQTILQSEPKHKNDKQYYYGTQQRGGVIRSRKIELNTLR